MAQNEKTAMLKNVTVLLLLSVMQWSVVWKSRSMNCNTSDTLMTLTLCQTIDTQKHLTVVMKSVIFNKNLRLNRDITVVAVRPES